MARARAQAATRNSSRFEIDGADKGDVWGLDYAGPFPPDVDDNVYFLQGVEVGRTNMGYVGLTKNRTAQSTLTAFTEMERQHGSLSSDPKDTVRVHSD